MKAVLMWFLILALPGSALAQSTETPQRKRARKAAAPRAASVEEVKELREQVASQQQQIQQLVQTVRQSEEARKQSEEQLRQALATATQAQTQAAVATTAISENKDTVGKLQSNMNDVRMTLTNSASNTHEEQKKIAGLEGEFRRFRWTGDVRVRYENFLFDPPASSGKFFNPRYRERIRLRLGVEGRLNEDFIGGIFFASGGLTDPTSTNETLTSNFEKKTVGFDRGYITYNPKAHKWLSLTGGKFAYPWIRTSVTFDPDLNPEGFSEKFSFDFRHPFLKNFTVQGVQLLFNETNQKFQLATSSTTPSSFNPPAADSFAAGGQVSAKFQFGRWTSTPSFTILNWRNVDSILASSGFVVGQTTTAVTVPNPTPPPATVTMGGIPVPGPGPGCASGGASIPPCIFAPNGFTNATVVDANGVTHFASQFLYADVIWNNQFKTGIEKLPLNLLLEYEDNLNANALPTVNLLRPCQPNCSAESHAYYAEISLGQTKNKGDFQVGYAWLRQEQDSVLASFNESDQRAPTNVLQHRFYALYKVAKNTTLGYTLWVGRTLDTNLQHAALGTGVTPGMIEPWLKRMQIDVIYTF